MSNVKLDTSPKSQLRESNTSPLWLFMSAATGNIFSQLWRMPISMAWARRTTRRLVIAPLAYIVGPHNIRGQTCMRIDSKKRGGF